MLSVPAVVRIRIDFEDRFDEMSDLLIALDLVQIRSDAGVGSAAYFVFVEVPAVH